MTEQASVTEEPDITGAPDRIEVFVGEDGEYYWHRIHGNNQIVAIGGEGYHNEQDAADMAIQVNNIRPGHILKLDILR